MNINILVVEDDTRIQDMVCKFLRNEGWLVDACANGDDALTLFYDKTYQLIILDIMLPGTNGQELLKDLREINDTPVLMMTALSDDDNQLRAFNNQVDDYVTKPFSISWSFIYDNSCIRNLLLRSTTLNYLRCFY